MRKGHHCGGALAKMMRLWVCKFNMQANRNAIEVTENCPGWSPEENIFILLWTEFEFG